jgi:hypothetical protein
MGFGPTLYSALSIAGTVYLIFVYIHVFCYILGLDNYFASQNSPRLAN